jgi:CheY-like chemotaxis protein
MAVMANYTASDSRRVLLVDDDTTLLELFSSILQYAGYKVDTAECGIEAIRKYRRDSADVIITDRAMPHMDGEQMTEVIKALNPEIPVILITGLPGSLRNPGLFTAVLPKPFRSADLLALIETALSTSAGTTR